MPAVPPAPLRYVLSDFFEPSEILHDGAFSHLDETDTCRPGALVYCQTFQYLQAALRNDHVAAILTTPELAAETEGKPLVATRDPRLAFFRAYIALSAEEFLTPLEHPGLGEQCRIHPTAVIAPGARLGDRVEVAPYAVIENNVEVLDDSYIGQHAVLGAEGLLTLWQPNGSPLRVKHAGGVRLGRDVQVLAGAVIARSLFPTPTTIGDRSQIGIMANIGHGAQLASDCVVSSNVVIAGRVICGKRVWIGASSSVAQGLRIGADAKVKMGSVVVGDVGANETVSGNFAVAHRANVKNFHRIRTL
ncbi:DapH/DapD/GlmU-related protein [Achromobacter xylosoxidans]|uniref:DapH/DapD/GlmU-related protein n=1 Tax=Alcaligenes xylosoxydans xylosoxydans TaxID=85698 RepID=UPI0006C44D02|nr:DapH/DapD/GlmU-related protein [Achromobacter xylosoxidans]MCH1987069.1 hypothetical protein [Achromobacter xylosoxidans]MCH4581772.1 hypothetical protein [Achromobacter xylosoxidans]MCH4584911.1 hypothetical protein [Achromobacter xylosoxidans]NYS14941.1 hypothetical protein [Achromobacter xylosoxidans]QKI75522.1 hypothetical protein HPS43_09070 [Achromobacter xylosoxidans]